MDENIWLSSVKSGIIYLLPLAVCSLMSWLHIPRSFSWPFPFGGDSHVSEMNKYKSVFKLINMQQ